MGIDWGIDVYPLISDRDAKTWEKFLDAVRRKYQSDEDVTITEDKIEFNVGEHPYIPTRSIYFKTFRSNSNGKKGDMAHGYILEILELMREYFRRNTRFWAEDDYCENLPIYDWEQVDNNEAEWKKFLFEKTIKMNNLSIKH